MRRPAAPVWEMARTRGAIPTEHLRDDQLDTPDFETTIAVPQDGDVPGVLFSFLPTEVRFPYLVVAHATMELTNNRQNIVDSSVNRFLVAVLARELARTAEGLDESGDSWKRLQAVTAAARLDPVLEKLDFELLLTAQIRKRRIIPTVDGEMRTAADGVWTIDADPAGWLPTENFGDLVLRTERRALRDAVAALGVGPLPASLLRERLEEVSPSLDIDARARLIAGLIRLGLMPSHHRHCCAIPRTARLPDVHTRNLPSFCYAVRGVAHAGRRVGPAPG